MSGKASRNARFQRLRKVSNADSPALKILLARRFLQVYPDVGPAWVTLGGNLIELARYDEAERALTRAIDLCPEEKLEIPLAMMGHLYRARGDFDRAEQWYNRAILADPADADGYIYLGGLLAIQGRFVEAEETCRRATECSEGCIDEAFLNLGLVLRAQERFVEAAECIREAIRLDPGYRAAKRALRDVKLCLKMLGRRPGE
jgi:tetratricopeptide (TPR) repeat protein